MQLNGIARQASIVFQNYSLLPWFSALENVRLAVDAAQPEWPRAKQKETVRAVSSARRSRQCHAPQAEPTVGRNAPACRYRSEPSPPIPKCCFSTSHSALWTR